MAANSTAKKLIQGFYNRRFKDFSRFYNRVEIAIANRRHPGRPRALATVPPVVVAILRNRSHYLGDVQAADQNAAEAAAASEFNLSDDQRKRVVVRERD